MKDKINYFIDSILYSYAQILFSNRKWLGFIALIATLINPLVGLCGIYGLIISNSIALLLKFDKEKIKTGFYGFNGILFGLSIPFYFELNGQMFLLLTVFIVLTFFLSAVLEHYLAIAFNLPGLSLPFILSLYIFLIFISNYNTIFYNDLTNYKEIVFFNNLNYYITYYFKSFSIIFFQKSILSGMLLAIGVLFFSRVLFLNSIIAYTLNIFVLSIILPNYDLDILLITSFNSILTSFALGGTLILISRKTIPLLFLSTLMIIVFSIFFTKLLIPFYLPVLVLPFNLVVLSVIYSLKFRKEQTDLVLLYFAPGSPEENFYYHNNRKFRFDKFKLLFPELPVFGQWTISQGVNGSLTHKDRFKDAWDFTINDHTNKIYSNSGNILTDYYCFSLPVVASLAGNVVNVIDNIQDNNVGEVNLKNNFGNTIVIDHGSGLFSAVSHLKYKSSKVKVGDYVEKGQIIGACGSSGRSPYPHLHFQFQLTNKVGDKTYNFPISHFIEKTEDNYLLKTFDYPKENSLVTNLEVHKTIKKAFNLQFGDEFLVECSLNNLNFDEKWEIDVDINNNLFIKSNNSSMAYIYSVEKVFYITNFFGNKNSALYFFYLNSIKIPFMYKSFLSWHDEFPLHLVNKSWIRFLSEFFLMFGEQIKAFVKYEFSKNENEDNKFYIQSVTEIKGKGIFSFFKNKGVGELVISNEGEIDSYRYSNSNIQFNAKIKYLGDE